MNNVDGQLDDGGTAREPPIARHGVTHETALTRDKLAAISVHLNGLPQRQQMTLQDAIKALSPDIKKLRDRGYSNHEVAAELRDNGLQVSSRTLARLTNTAKPAARAKRGPA